MEKAMAERQKQVFEEANASKRMQEVRDAEKKRVDREAYQADSDALQRQLDAWNKEKRDKEKAAAGLRQQMGDARNAAEERQRTMREQDPRQMKPQDQRRFMEHAPVQAQMLATMADWAQTSAQSANFVQKLNELQRMAENVRNFMSRTGP
jgi:hypothetical protein